MSSTCFVIKFWKNIFFSEKDFKNELVYFSFVDKDGFC